MISYGTLWPCGCLIEQTLIEKKTFRNYDWMKCLRWDIRWRVFFGLLQQALIDNRFALQIQFIRFLLYGTHHILLDKTRWRHVAAHRHQVIAVQSDHRADRVWSHGHQFLSLLHDSDGGQLVCPGQTGGTYVNWSPRSIRSIVIRIIITVAAPFKSAHKGIKSLKDRFHSVCRLSSAFLFTVSSFFSCGFRF